MISHQETLHSILAANTWPQIAPNAVMELLRFLCLVSLGESETEALVSQELDEIWHAIILDTRLYRSICLALPGNKFLDHVPGETHSLLSKEGMHKAMQSMIAYVRHFGPFTKDVLIYWPAVSDLASAFDLSLTELNNRLIQMGHLVLEDTDSTRKT